jgi:minor extracellular serine protease Vpr
MKAGVLAYFSSRGPTPANLLKPDISAPGYGLYSATPRSVDPSRFQIGAGTSFAAPFVSAAAALLRQRHPSWSVSEIKAALMGSATDALSFGVPADIASPLRGGAGYLEVTRALEAEVTSSPSSVSFTPAKLTSGVDLSATLSFSNKGSVDVSYAAEVLPVSGGTDLLATLGESSVNIAAGSTATLTLGVSASRSAAPGDYTGFVILRRAGTESLRVPYWIRLEKK